MLYARYTVSTQRISTQKVNVASFTMKTLNVSILAASFLLWATTLAVPLSGHQAGSFQPSDRNLTLPISVIGPNHAYAPSSLDLKQSLTLSSRPYDPYDYRARGSRQTIRFSNYGPTLANIGIEECVARAVSDLVGRRGRVYEYKDDLEYSAYGVVVKMVPSQVMTWLMWDEAIFGILKFSRAEFAGVLRFEIMQDGIVGWVGKGSIEGDGVGQA